MKEARTVEVGGISLRCDHCEGDRFVVRKAQLNTALMTYLGLDWLNESASVYVCAGCGRLHWFVENVQSASDTSYPIECMACGATIPPRQPRCEACGWTYEAPEEESAGES